MLLLTSTSDRIKVVTSAAVATDVHASWVDNAAGTITPDRSNTAITTAAATDVVPGPGASSQRNVQTLTVRNKHASSAQTVTVQHTDGSTTVDLFKVTLDAGEELQFVDGDGWSVFSNTGARKTVQEAVGATPVGGIIMWSGAIASIPEPWALCDGTANAPGPDLRDKFIVGASSDDAGVAKTNIRGSLEQSATATGHSHSAHAALSHAGGAVGDHTGLTHGLSIADHPDLTHAALSHPSMPLSHADHAVASLYHTHAAFTLTHGDHSLASSSHSHAAVTLTHADHSLASFSHSHAAVTLTHADHSLASFSGTEASGADVSVPSQAIASLTTTGAAMPTLALSISSQGTARTIHTAAQQAGSVTMTEGSRPVAAVTASRPSASHTHAASTLAHADHSVASFSGTGAAQTVTHGDHVIASFSGTDAAQTVTHADHAVASVSGTHAAYTLTHPDHAFPSLSHQDIGTHAGTDYGVHAVTAPAAHGAAGTVTHSFTQPDAHAISAHDTVSMVPSFFALAFIQRMA